ncbi:MAG: GNAT family N-acetyltransferase [Ardenticatenales bacterium]|nr:GNAT family N-acetyltransferase [Ardenticatenales bacterium]
MSWTIEAWSEIHPRWGEMVRYIEGEELDRAVLAAGRLVDEGRLLAAVHGGEIVGFLMFLVQPIGPEMDCPVLCDSEGTALTEAKIRAFHVREAQRGQGIGTALQRAVLRLAGELGCYQVRSLSSYTRHANYAIKLKLGFVAHPTIRQLKDRQEPSVYWIKRVGDAR